MGSFEEGLNQLPTEGSSGIHEASMREILHGELLAIHKRRQACFSTSHPPESSVSQLEIPPDEKSGWLGEAWNKLDDTELEKKELVGMAVSGGGIRSAMFNLGLLQAFSQRGLLRCLDYIASVSGGGYIAGHLACLMRCHVANGAKGPFVDSPAARLGLRSDGRLDRPSDRRPEPQVPAGSGGEGDATSPVRPASHYRFADAGRYLSGWPDLAWRYVLCTIPTVVCFLGLLGMFATILALVWRTFDQTPVRDLFTFLGLMALADEVFTAYLPCLLLPPIYFVVGIPAWRIFRARGESRRRLVRAFLPVLGILILIAGYAACVALGGEWVWVLGAVAVAIPAIPVLLVCFAEQCEPGVVSRVWSLRRWRDVSGHAIVLVVACGAILLSYLAAGFDVACGWWLSLSGAALLAYLLAFGAMAAIEPKAIRALLFLECGAVIVSTAIVLGNGVAGTSNLQVLSDMGSVQKSATVFSVLLALLNVLPFFDLRRVLQSGQTDARPWQRVAFWCIVRGALIGVVFTLVLVMGRDNISNYADTRSPELARADVLDWGTLFDVMEESRIEHPSTMGIAKEASEVARLTAAKLYAPDERSDRPIVAEPPFWTSGGTCRFWELLRDGLTRGPQSDLARYWSQQRDLYASQELFVERLAAQHWLSRRELSEWLMPRIKKGVVPSDPLEAGQYIALRNRAERSLIGGGGDPTASRTPTAGMLAWETNAGISGTAAAGGKGLESWTSAEIARFNRLLLELYCPDVVRKRAMPSTPIVAGPDQWRRMGWLMLWGVLFLATFWVPLNRIAPFYDFYRKKLAESYAGRPCQETSAVDRQADSCPCSGACMRLSELSKTAGHGPYPLFVATLMRMDQANGKRHESFVLSPLFCGSEVTGYFSTGQYPGYAHAMEQGGPRLDVAEAMALSGSAISPLMVDDPFLWLMMGVLNLRLGKWLINPRNSSGQQQCGWWGREFRIWHGLQRMAARFRDEQADDERQRYVLVADGGFRDYLGIEELLTRRCRLIIVSDASRSRGKDEFSVLASTINLARTCHGIEFLDLDHDRPIDFERLWHDEQREGHVAQQILAARIRYPKHDGKTWDGLLIYVQMALSGVEDVTVQQIRRLHPKFPDEPTTNQQYTPEQVEAYRQLGYQLGITLCREMPLLPTSDSPNGRTVRSPGELCELLTAAYVSECLRERVLHHTDVHPARLAPARRPTILGQQQRFHLGLSQKTPIAVVGMRCLEEYARNADFRRWIRWRAARYLDAPLDGCEIQTLDSPLSPSCPAALLAVTAVAFNELATGHQLGRDKGLLQIGGVARLIDAATQAFPDHKNSGSQNEAARPFQAYQRFVREVYQSVFRERRFQTASQVALYLAAYTSKDPPQPQADRLLKAALKRRRTKRRRRPARGSPGSPHPIAPPSK